jgi:rare lipoprotein A (peptidoglycan hydrolase)
VHRSTWRAILGACLILAGGVLAVPLAAETPVAGMASVYSDRLQGKAVATGEFYDKEGLTAAANQFPLGATVRVTNPANGKSVTVRVNDRHGRHVWFVIQVSRAAAEALEFSLEGRAEVELAVLASPEATGRDVPHQPPPQPPPLRTAPVATLAPAAAGVVPPLSRPVAIEEDRPPSDRKPARDSGDRTRKPSPFGDGHTDSPEDPEQ